VQRTYTVTDSCGNSTNKIQNITVSDTTPPVITSIPTNLIVQCASAVPAPNTAAVVATDNCGGTLVITFSDQTFPGACADRFVVLRTYIATDGCSNSSSRTQTIVVSNTTLPTISCPTAALVSCASLVPAPATDYASFVAQGGSAAANCGGTVTVSFVGDVTNSQTCDNRFTITRTYKAVDSCGNSRT